MTSASPRRRIRTASPCLCTTGTRCTCRKVRSLSIHIGRYNGGREKSRHHGKIFWVGCSVGFFCAVADNSVQLSCNLFKTWTADFGAHRNPNSFWGYGRIIQTRIRPGLGDSGQSKPALIVGPAPKRPGKFGASNSGTSAANVTGYLRASNRVMGPTALRPWQRPCHVSSTLAPRGSNIRCP